MTAIVYTSNTGYTAEYAKILSEKTGLKAYTLLQARENIPKNSEIIYMGWIMAGGIKGYKKAAGRYTVRAVAAVGMGAPETQYESVRKTNALPQNLPLFVLQGGFDIEKLHGVYKLMMKIMSATLGKAIANKTDRTADETAMLQLMQNGGSYVSADNLDSILKWYSENEDTRIMSK